MEYDFIKQQQDQLKISTQEFSLNIKSWEGYPNRISLNWNYIKFEQGNAGRIPQLPGVYAFFVKPGIASFQENSYLFYIGKAGDNSDNNLRKRFGQYLSGKRTVKRPKLNWFLNTWDNYIFFCYAPISDKRVNLGRLERELNDAFIPPYNENDFSTDVRKAVKVLR